MVVLEVWTQNLLWRICDVIFIEFLFWNKLWITSGVFFNPSCALTADSACIWCSFPWKEWQGTISKICLMFYSKLFLLLTESWLHSFISKGNNTGPCRVIMHTSSQNCDLWPSPIQACCFVALPSLGYNADFIALSFSFVSSPHSPSCIPLSLCCLYTYSSCFLSHPLASVFYPLS